jgi:hypothetical protein
MPHEPESAIFENALRRIPLRTDRISIVFIKARPFELLRLLECGLSFHIGCRLNSE